MDLKQLVDRSIYKPLTVDSPNAMTLRKFLDLAFDWGLTDAQLLQGLRQFGLGTGSGGEGGQSLGGQSPRRCLSPYEGGQPRREARGSAAVPSGAATPVIITDGSSALNAANLNKYLNAEGKTSVKMRYARLIWSSGTTFAVSSTVDAAGIVDANLAWNTTLINYLNITISGFSIVPLMAAQRISSGFYPSIDWSILTLAGIGWFNSSGTLQTTPATGFDSLFLAIGS